jgi:hypothetical protein
MSDTDILRELHEAYVWEVNAAVGEDRMDLVWQLADEYTDRALALITETESPDCGRPDCAICAGRTSAPTASAPTASAPTAPARGRRTWWAHRRGAA